MGMVMMMTTMKVGGGADLLPAAGHQRETSAQGGRAINFAGKKTKSMRHKRTLSVCLSVCFCLFSVCLRTSAVVVSARSVSAHRFSRAPPNHPCPRDCCCFRRDCWAVLLQKRETAVEAPLWHNLVIPEEQRPEACWVFSHLADG